MTDQEAIAKAQKELDMANYFGETSIHAGLQTVHRNRADWLCRVLGLAKKALNIEENQKHPQTNADRIRAKSDEELEDFLHTEEWMCDTYNSCSACPLRGEKGCISILEWLKQPAEE